jgi:hypothetical protein
VEFTGANSTHLHPTLQVLKFPISKPYKLTTHIHLLIRGFILSAVAAIPSVAQTSLPDAPQPQSQASDSKAGRPSRLHEYGKHHILWVIPNYREDESGAQFTPLTPKQKLKLAFDDSFDPTAFLVAGIFAADSMAQKQYAFGQGAEGFAKYYGGAFADQAIGNMMSEALFPIALHQDPRYFERGSGGFWKRTGYAMSRELITRGDDGRNHFNTSELAGNAVAAGISNFYYPAVNRSLGNTANKWGQQIALDTAFNVAKEFWPDVRHKFFHQ